MNNSSLDDLLAKQTAAENAYYQAGSPSSGPIYNAYISALNAVDKLQTQIENTNYNTPGVEYKPAPVIVDETGRITGAVAQPGGLTAVPLSNVDTNPAPVDYPQVSAGETVATPPADAQQDGNTSGYGEQNDTQVPGSEIDTAPAPVDPYVAQDLENGAGTDIAVPTADVNTQAGAVDAQTASLPGGTGGIFTGSLFGLNAAGQAAGRIVGQVTQTQNQQNNTNLAQQPLNTDWRVILRLAPNSDYLYNAADAGLLAPLKVTNGVIFPYTPQISTAYKANYSNYDLTHSNYRGYFYQNSYVDAITLNASFTAQSTSDAAYVLAVIHFFRSVTKMFYGQDAQRGSPPPLVFLSGLGDYQFNNHPCLVQQFNYTLPPDVDYISSGSPNNLGLNLNPLQNLYSTTLNAVSPTVTRLASAFLPAGAQNILPAPLKGLLNNPTYVPSKLDIALTLLPIQSRQQVSQQFSLKGFANGQLLKGGFW
jgi:hypothetical protein